VHGFTNPTARLQVTRIDWWDDSDRTMTSECVVCDRITMTRVWYTRSHWNLNHLTWRYNIGRKRTRGMTARPHTPPLGVHYIGWRNTSLRTSLVEVGSLSCMTVCQVWLSMNSRGVCSSCGLTCSQVVEPGVPGVCVRVCVRVRTCVRVCVSVDCVLLCDATVSAFLGIS